jgi:hypothetical protein
MSKAKKQTVHVCLYSHKCDVNVGVYKTAKALEAGVLNVMAERVETWDLDDQTKYRKLRSFDKKLALFRDVEQNISYGDTLELFELELEG